MYLMLQMLQTNIGDKLFVKNHFQSQQNIFMVLINLWQVASTFPIPFSIYLNSLNLYTQRVEDKVEK